MPKTGEKRENIMCSTTTEVKIIGGTTIKVDSCISGIVQALNDAGIETAGSCCGHGIRPGRIFLKGRTIYIQEMDDGSELFVKHADDEEPHFI